MTRAMSLASAASIECSFMRTPQLMLHWLRSAWKPLCISAAAERAHARAEASVGQTPAWRSPRYSRMASESQTWRPSWCSTGTRLVGDLPAIERRNPSPNTWFTSSNGMPSSLISAQGRSDQDE